MKSRNHIFGSIVALSLAAPTAAFAGGYELPIQGVRATAMAGAQVAGASRVDAFWYNPALLDATGVDLGVSIVSLSASYTRSDGDQAGQTVSNEASALPNPSIGAVYRLSDHFSFGLAAYAPYGAQYKFPENGPQRYSLVENDKTKVLFVHAAVSYRVEDLSVGIGLQNVIGHVVQRSTYSGYTGLFGYAEDPELDVLTEIELSDPTTFTANLGAAYRLGPVTLGASLQLPYSMSGEADLRVRLPSSVFFDNVEVQGDKMTIEIPFPLMLRGGVAVDITPDVRVETAVNFEGWSVQDSIQTAPVGEMKLTGVPGVGDYVLAGHSIDRRMQDTVSFHLGADGRVIDRLHLRGGLFYEPSSFGDETFSVALLDDDKVGATFGASWGTGPFTFDLALARIFQGTRVVDSSELHQINPTNQDQTTVIGNGTYDSGFWLFGGMVSVDLE